jgi:hypothetical protein
MPGRSAHCARTALLASGNVNRKRELLRRAELSDQALKGLAQVGDSSLGCIALVAMLGLLGLRIFEATSATSPNSAFQGPLAFGVLSSGWPGFSLVATALRPCRLTGEGHWFDPSCAHQGQDTYQ